MSSLWDCEEHSVWLKAEEYYFNFLPANNTSLEIELEALNTDEVKNMCAEEFYSFLYDKYYVWKYTAKNRLATTRRSLAYYNSNLEELLLIKDALFAFNPGNTALGLKIALLIRGLGTAGASGLLSVLFPKNFGTVDQFVVKRLCEFSQYENDPLIRGINPEGITLTQAVMLEKILTNKADSLNKANRINYWTPRKIDKVLWSLNR